MIRRFFALLATGFLLASVATAPAQAEPPLVSLALAKPGAVLRAGAPATLEFWATIKKPFHINSHKPENPDLIPTVLTVTAPMGIAFGPYAYPKPEKVKLAISPAPVLLYHGRVALKVAVKIPAGLAPGAYRAKAVLDYQACDDQSCLMPEQAMFDFKITIGR